MNDEILLQLLRYDLNRAGARPDDGYLVTLIQAARLDIERSGIRLPTDQNDPCIQDFQVMVAGTAAWMYTKRRTGEDMPRYVRSLRNRALLAQKAKGSMP